MTKTLDYNSTENNVQCWKSENKINMDNHQISIGELTHDMNL